MNENKTLAETTQPSQTTKVGVTLSGIQQRCSQIVVVEVPSDATQADIMNLGESAWRHLAPSDKWSPDDVSDDVWDDKVEFDFSDVTDEASIDARFGRTSDGDLVVLNELIVMGAGTNA
jgi:hypothetical protein